MAEVERIDVNEARSATTKGALFVCAYEDEEKCNRLKLEGAISLANFQSRVCRLANGPGDHLLLRLTCGGECCRSGSTVSGARIHEGQGAQGRRGGLAKGGIPDGGGLGG